MTLRKQGKYWRGDDLDDLREEMRRFSSASYAIARDLAPACACGGGVMTEAFGAGTFFIAADDEEGGAALICGNCGSEGFVADSQRYMRPAILEDEDWCECVCGKRDFHVLVGAAFYSGSTDVRWWYVGGRCVHCGVLGVYVDWKDDGSRWEPVLRPRAKKTSNKRAAAKRAAAKPAATKKPNAKKPASTTRKGR